MLFPSPRVRDESSHPMRKTLLQSLAPDYPLSAFLPIKKPGCLTWQSFLKRRRYCFPVMSMPWNLFFLHRKGLRYSKAAITLHSNFQSKQNTPTSLISSHVGLTKVSAIHENWRNQQNLFFLGPIFTKKLVMVKIGRLKMAAEVLLLLLHRDGISTSPVTLG